MDPSPKTRAQDYLQKFLLRVVATQLPKPGDPKPILLSSLFESRDEIPFKGGRFVTSQILECFKNHKNLKLLFLTFYIRLF